MKKIKLLHVNTLQPPYLVGGAERTVATVSNSLAARGHSIRVMSTVPTDAVVADHVSEHFQGKYVGLRNFYWPFDGATRPKLQTFAWHLRDAWNPAMGNILGHALDADRPDMLLTHNLQGWSCNVWWQAAKRKIPVIHVIHDQSLICPQTAMFRGGTACTKQCTSCRVLSTTRRAAQHHVTAVIAVSQAILDRNAQFGMFGSHKTKRVVHNSWRGEWPKTCPPLPSVALPNHGLTIGFMGRVEGEKGIDTLCAAWRKLEGTGARLLIAGEGKPAYIQSLIREYGVPQSSFLGQQPPHSFFSCVDIVAVPSRAFEGLGNVAFESLVFGRPVIVSDQGGLPEIPRLDCGTVVTSGDVEALATAIRGYIDSPAMLLAHSSAAMQRSLAFRPERQADAYENLLEEVCDQPR